MNDRSVARIFGTFGTLGHTVIVTTKGTNGCSLECETQVPTLWPGVSFCRAESLGTAQIIVRCVVKTCDPEVSTESEEIDLFKLPRRVEKVPPESGGDVHGDGIQRLISTLGWGLFLLLTLKMTMRRS